MKLIPLKDMLAFSKEKLDEKLAPARAKQIKSKAELKMAELEERIGSKQNEVQELYAKRDFDFDKLMDILDEIAILELRHANYKEVIEQLFPTEVA